MFRLNDATAETVREVLVQNVSCDATLYTDESRLYTKNGTEYAAHRTVKHSANECARREGENVVHTNTIENVFSVFKRGMIGTYQHYGEAHLHRYLAEFDFRYNRRTALKVTDTERRDDALRGIEGKCLTYRGNDEAPNA
jgi:transposase-like protein